MYLRYLLTTIDCRVVILFDITKEDGAAEIHFLKYTTLIDSNLTSITSYLPL
jgi:hypothetical protein